MANPEHVELLKRGVEAWNAWREGLPALSVDLRDADLRDAGLSGAQLSGADLTGAGLGRAQLVGAILIGAHLRGTDLNDAILIGANARDSDLCDAGLTGAYVTGASLDDAQLRGANLTGADLSSASLRGADLSSASLRGANLTGADLSNASLREADLTGAHLRGADLERAVLSRAIVSLTAFNDVDLRNAIGLETVHHGGPSTVGIDTLFKSQGRIPEVFLRGCGVPDSFIAYARSLVGKAIEYYSCFISYNSRDQAFAERLHARMQAEHLRVWFAPEDMKGGEKIEEQIDRAIRVYDKLLLVISPHSMDSEWVKTEIYKARQREIREKRRMLFPIRLVPFEQIRDWGWFDADSGKDLAREIREYFIPDFTGWKDHDRFEAEFARLLDALRGKTSMQRA